MLPLAEIGGLARTVDAAWRSAVADAVARRWGCPGGAARWWRSSASHVFVVEGTGYLRFVPAALRAREGLAAVVELVDALRDREVGVAGPIRSTAGNLLETVDTALGPVHAMCVAAAPGERVDGAALSPVRARAWGAALARLHDAAADLGRGLPHAFEDLRRAPVLFPDDPELVAAIARVVGDLAALPRNPVGYGVVHGDFELDNLAWEGNAPTAFDFDDAARSWFVADIVFATREAESPADFLAGYREIRPLPDDEFARRPLFAAAHAAASLVRLRPILDAEPADLGALRAKLVRHSDTQRRVVLAAG